MNQEQRERLYKLFTLMAKDHKCIKPLPQPCSYYGYENMNLQYMIQVVMFDAPYEVIE